MSILQDQSTVTRERQLLAQATEKMLSSHSRLGAAQKISIRAIIRANLESGRIHRRFDGQLPRKAGSLLTAYLDSIARFYLAENSKLLALCSGCPTTWLDLGDWLKRCAHAKLERINASAGLIGLTAEDFVQEINLWLLERLSRVEGDPESMPFSTAAGLAIGYTYDVPFAAWIAKIQSRRIVDAARRFWRQGKARAGLDIEAIAAEDILEGALERMTFRQELGRLTLNQREVLEQLVVGASVREVAENLDCTGRAVYNRKYAAIERLRMTSDLPLAASAL